MQVVATLLFLGIAYGFETKYIGYEELLHDINDLKSEFQDAKKAMQEKIDNIIELYNEEKKKNLELSEKITALERKMAPVGGSENYVEHADASTQNVWSGNEFINTFEEKLFGKANWNVSDVLSKKLKTKQTKKTKSPTAFGKSDIQQKRKRATAGQKVAFFAGDIDPAHGPWTHQETLVFNVPLIDVGGDYNFQTGLFQCSIAGTYVFHFSIDSKQSTSYVVSLVRNGDQSKSHVFLQPATTYSYGASNFAIIHLDVGDTVWLRLVGTVPSDLQFGRGENTFGGFLLYPE